jgi:beta-galactosidase
LAKATEVDCSQWEQDLKNFKELGLNTFRLFICWDRVEQKRGERDFSKIDYAFDLADKYNLKVIVNTGGTFANLQAIYAPRWLVYDEDCQILMPTPNTSEKLEANRFYLCYDDPKYQELAKDFLQEAIARYKDCSSLLAWSGWNEPRISECFCKHSTKQFREWLKNKYGNIDELEKAWSTEFPVSFRDWSDVFPQKSANFSDGGYVPFLDWKYFLEYNRKSKFELIQKWIKEIDSETPVISHVCTPHDSDIFGSEDILGTSIYKIHGDGKRDKPFTAEEFANQSTFLMSRGFRKHRKDPQGFWVVETEAGPVSWVHNTMPRSYTARQMNARDLSYISYGARAIQRWLYRSRISDAQAGEFNLVGWDGTITERARAFGELAAKVNQNTSIFLNHLPSNNDIYILGVNDYNYHAEAEGYGWRYHNSLYVLTNALRHLGYNFHVCNERQIHEGILNEAKILFCPHCIYLNAATEKVLRIFVKKGGSIIAETPFAIKNREGIHYEKTPGNMVDIFGAQVYDMERLGDDQKLGKLPGYDLIGHIRLQGGTVEAEFDTGSPAIVSNNYGKGRAVLYASQVVINYSNASGVISCPENARLIKAELKKQLDLAGVASAWELSCTEDVRNHIHIAKRMLPDGRKLVFVINMDDKDHSIKVKIPKLINAKELISSDEMSAKINDEEYSFDFKDWGWSVLLESDK